MEYQVLSEDCRKNLEVKSEKNMVCRVSKNGTRQRSLFAECQDKTLNKGLTAVALCRVLLFDTRQNWSLPSVILCRVFGTRQTTFLSSVICLPSAFYMTLGKQPLYRVPDKKHSSKSGTLNKEAVSGSVRLYFIQNVCDYPSKISLRRCNRCLIHFCLPFSVSRVRKVGVVVCVTLVILTCWHKIDRFTHLLSFQRNCYKHI